MHLVTHKITEGVGWTDPTVAGRAAQLQRFAAPGFYHVLWPTNSQDNPQNQAKWFVDEVVRLARWMLAHPCPVLQGDFELFQNFVPYRAPTITECNQFQDWVAHYWGLAGGNPPAQLAYAPYWLYGGGVTGLKHLWWASSYVAGSGGYHPLYPGNSDSRWTQVAGHPAAVLQYSASATFGTGAVGVDANAVRGVTTAQQLQEFLLGGGDPPVTESQIKQWVRDVLNEGAGQGTTSWSQTNQNMYNRTGDIINKLNALSAAGADDATKAQLDAAVAAILNAGADDATKTELADAVATLLAAINAIPGGGGSGPVKYTLTATGELTPQPPAVGQATADGAG